MSAVNIEVAIPSDSTTAKPRIAPVPNTHSTMPAIRVVTFESAIRAGYEKAFSAIADSNITTLIAGVVLFTFGSGPVRGFAVVLSLGIVTSMFTALVVSRVLVYLLWDRKRKLDRLSIGMGY